MLILFFNIYDLNLKLLLLLYEIRYRWFILFIDLFDLGFILDIFLLIVIFDSLKFDKQLFYLTILLFHDLEKFTIIIVLIFKFFLNFLFLIAYLRLEGVIQSS